MKVVIDGRLLDKKHNTGISRYTRFMINYYLEKNYDVSLILNDESENIAGCRPIVTHHRPFNILHFRAFHRFVHSLDFDILHVPFYSGINKRSARKGKVVITVHDLMYKIVPDFFGTNRMVNKLKELYFDYIVARSLKNADITLAVSQTTKNDIKRFFNVESHVVPEHSEISGVSDTSILSRLNLPPKGYFLYCGNNRNHKNISFIKSVFSHRNDGVPLVLVGKGHKPDRNVVTSGLVTDNELKALYENAIAFIFPSQYEGFGLPVLEALHCNIPVICSDIPVFREFNSQNIIYFNLGDENSFKNAIKLAKTQNYIHQPSFLAQYSPAFIHRRLDEVLSI